MKRRIRIPFIGWMLLVLICCGMVALFINGYHLPFKPCRPIIFPNGMQITAQVSYTTTVSLDAVLSFYDQRLDAQPFPEDALYWKKEELRDSKYLYYCYAGDINFLTTETGCIYVVREEKSTRIDTMLLRSEGSNTPCPKTWQN